MTSQDAMGSSPPTARVRVDERQDTQGVSSRNFPFKLRIGFVVGILLFITLLFGAVRFRLRNMPLERDEGEYAYSGQLILQGIPPYRLSYNLKLPGIYAAYAVVLAAFGQTPSGIHLALLLVNALSSILMYLLASKLFGRLAGLVAAASYSLLSASPTVMGFEAHATNFVVLPALCGILFLLRGLSARTRWLFFACGLCCGIAFLMKQHGIFFAFFCFFYLIRDGMKSKNGFKQLATDVLAMLAGFVLPYLVACFLLYRFGVFQQFWFWTVTYAGEYSKMGLRRGVRAFRENYGAILRANILIWAVALVGLSAAFWNHNARRHLSFTASLLFFSFLALCPGAYFRPHYFVLLLPAAALFVGVGVSAATSEIRKPESVFLKYAPAMVFVLAFGFSILQQRTFYFSLDPEIAVRETYGNNLFASAKKIGESIRQTSPIDARVAVLGSEPEIYFYSQRHSATGYLYMYSVIVRQKYTERMQQELMQEVQSSRPEYVVYVDVPDSWGEDREQAPQAIAFLTWLRDFTSTYYEVVNVARVDDPGAPVAGKNGARFASNIPAIYLLKRKADR